MLSRSYFGELPELPGRRSGGRSDTLGGSPEREWLTRNAWQGSLSLHGFEARAALTGAGDGGSGKRVITL